jgi:hypothetical protein
LLPSCPIFVGVGGPKLNYEPAVWCATQRLKGPAKTVSSA